MKEKKKGNSIMKTSLTILATVVVVLVAVVVFSFWYTSVDSEIKEIGVIESDYISAADAFEVDYGIASPEQVTSSASLERALGGVESAKSYLAVMKANATQIRAKVAESKSEFSGDKLTWFEKVDSCYANRISMIGVLEEVLTNEEKYFVYYEHYSKFESIYGEFSNLLPNYLVYTKAEDNVNAKKTLEEMKMKVSSMKEELTKANEAVPMTFLSSYIKWTEEYTEVMDLSIRYYSVSGSEQTSISNQVLSKGMIAGNTLKSAQNSASEDFDKWYIPSVTNKRDEAGKQMAAANKECDSAGALYTSLFP